MEFCHGFVFYCADLQNKIVSNLILLAYFCQQGNNYDSLTPDRSGCF